MCNVELAGIRADIVFEVTVRVGWQLWLADQCHRHFVDHAQVLKVVGDVESQFAVQAGYSGHTNVVNQQTVAIRRGLGDLGHADAAAGAGNVFNHKVGTATHGFAHGFGQVACHAVSRAARSKWHGQRNRFRTREGLRVRKDGCGGKRQNKKLFHVGNSLN